MKKSFSKILWFIIPALIAGIVTQYMLGPKTKVVEGLIIHITENEICKNIEVEIKTPSGINTYLIPYESEYILKKMVTAIDIDEKAPVVVTAERVFSICSGLNSYEIKELETKNEPDYIDVEELMNLIKEYSE